MTHLRNQCKQNPWEPQLAKLEWAQESAPFDCLAWTATLQRFPQIGCGQKSMTRLSHRSKIQKTSVANVSKRRCCLTCFLSREACRVALTGWHVCPPLQCPAPCNQLALRMTHEWLKSTQSRLPSLNVNECVADLIRKWRCTWAFP